jgi:hypothetical protein
LAAPDERSAALLRMIRVVNADGTGGHTIFREPEW